MGRLTGKHRRQPAVYWEKSGVSKFNRPTVSSPIELRVRWVKKMTETLDLDNRVIRSDVMVKTDRALTIGSIIRLGRLRNLPSPVNSGLFQVVVQNSVPNLKQTETTHTAFLIRYSDTLPDIV